MRAASAWDQRQPG